MVSNEKYHQSLNSGMLYHVLVDLKPETVRTMFAEVDVSFCDQIQLCEALKELILRRNVQSVKCLEQVFQSRFDDIRRTAKQHEFWPLPLLAFSDQEVDGILRSNDDYLVTAFNRYFTMALKPIPASKHSSKLTNFASFVNQIYTKHLQASPDLWRRFLRCLITVDSDFTFLTELVNECKDNANDTTVLQACLIPEIVEKVSAKKLQDLRLLELAMMTGYDSDETLFRLLLQAFRDVIDPNTFEVPMPKTLFAEVLPSGSTCTLLMALCLNEVRDTTSLLRVFLNTFPTHIDIYANKFYAVLCHVKQTERSVLKQLLPRVIMAYQYFWKKGDITLTDKEGNTTVHQATKCASMADFNLHQLDMGQFDPSTCQNSISLKLSCNFFWYFMTLFGYILSIIWQNMAMLPYLRKKLLKIYFSGQFDPNVVWQLV